MKKLIILAYIRTRQSNDLDSLSIKALNRLIIRGRTSEDTVGECATKNLTSSITNHQNKDLSLL